MSPQVSFLHDERRATGRVLDCTRGDRDIGMQTIVEEYKRVMSFYTMNASAAMRPQGVLTRTPIRTFRV